MVSFVSENVFDMYVSIFRKRAGREATLPRSRRSLLFWRMYTYVCIYIEKVPKRRVPTWVPIIAERVKGREGGRLCHVSAGVVSLVSANVYIYMYIYTAIYVYIYIYIYMYRKRAGMGVDSATSVQVWFLWFRRRYQYVCVYSYIYIYVYICICICMYIYMYIYIFIYKKGGKGGDSAMSAQVW